MERSLLTPVVYAVKQQSSNVFKGMDGRLLLTVSRAFLAMSKRATARRNGVRACGCREGEDEAITTQSGRRGE